MEKIIGKYSVVQARTFLTNDKEVQTPVLHTDNCREAIWVANQDPINQTPINICGERDFYKGKDGKWHSFEL